MTTEKLTLDRVASNIEIELTKYIDYETSPYVIAEIKNLLTQIRDEIITSDYHYNISQRTIEEIFNKYLTEEGGN